MENSLFELSRSGLPLVKPEKGVAVMVAMGAITFFTTFYGGSTGSRVRGKKISPRHHCSTAKPLENKGKFILWGYFGLNFHTNQFKTSISHYCYNYTYHCQTVFYQGDCRNDKT